MKALILVDLQNDFMPGGALGVPEGDRVVPVANALGGRFDVVVASQDWHPPDHASFAIHHPGRRVGDIIDLDGISQVLWPVHCVQGTVGAEFVDALDRRWVQKVFRKGTDREIDSYSAFFDNGHRKSTGLADYLRSQEVSDVHLMGLATDYCVKFSALDACQLGFKTTLIEDACRGVELEAGDVDRAVRDMRQAGVSVVTSGTIE
jgi:nicotinamidase/pyrazinamidase